MWTTSVANREKSSPDTAWTQASFDLFTRLLITELLISVQRSPSKGAAARLARWDPRATPGAPQPRKTGRFGAMVHAMSNSPLSILKARFGDDPKKAKEKLVAAVKKAAGKDLWLDRLNEEKGLQHVSNRKLLHLEQVLEAVNKAVGSRDKLIGEIAKLQGRSKDKDYMTRLGEESTPSLWDRYQSVQSSSSGASGSN